MQHLCGSYLAREGYCEVVVLAHGALGLPMKSDGRPPQPYIAGYVKRSIRLAHKFGRFSNLWEFYLPSFGNCYMFG